jgi:omega-6 fatty acid desaturase (delta-12 desaturase)
MSSPTDSQPPSAANPDWYLRTKRFEHADARKSLWQIFNTLVPYLLLWVVMVRMAHAGYPYWTLLLMSVPAGFFMVRLFILFHDCAHGSFFRSKRANRIVGSIFGILTFTPYDKWRASHWRHHATVADLDQRGSGDFWTLTREEYVEASRSKRLAYRLARNPLVVFVLGPLFVFLIYQRFPIWTKSKQERNSVHWTNLGIAVMALAAGLTFGFRTYLLIQLPVLFVAGMLGLWLFYVQHNFEGVYWARHAEWDRMDAALIGSSFYQLPKVLQWFTGSIGYHFIHHLRPLIPNYSLEACYDSEPELQNVAPLTIRKSLRSLFLHLWDESDRKLVKFSAVK